MKLLLNSPLWYVLLCIAIGGLGAFLLYRKDKSLSELSTVWKRVLAGLRFLSLFFISFLLLEPLFQYTKEKSEKPILVFAHDNSESIISSKDSLLVKENLERNFKELKQKLASKYEIISYGFGKSIEESASFDFSEKQTDISGFLKEIQTRYFNRNLGGIVLSSDGIYNKGSNPLFEAKKLKNIPIYTISLGDTAQRKDLFIDNIYNNRLVYKGNRFPVVVSVKAEECKGENTTIKILKGGRLLSEKALIVDENNFLSEIKFELEANSVGLQRYEVVLSEIEGEFSVSNNRKSFFVDVVESKQKILILANSPHPDVNAIKSGLESNQNYEVTTSLISKYKGKVEGNNLLILYNLPSFSHGVSIVEGKGIPVLYVIGNQVSLSKFNLLNTGLKITNGSGFTEAQTNVNSNFSLFEISPKLSSFASIFTPLQVPFTTNYKISNSCEIVFYQSIGPVKTKYPVLLFNKRGANKIGVFLGEGVWRWKLQDYSLNESNVLFNEWITQTAQYLVSKEDKSLFRVNSKSEFYENEKVSFEAEVYNESYELVNSSEVKIDITNENGENFAYLFSKTGKKYKLDAGAFSPGNYSYNSSVNIGGKVLNKTGQFSVNELQVEQNNLVANTQLLYNMSDITGGKLLTISSMSSLEKLLDENTNMVSVIYQEKEVSDLIYLKIIFFFILLLLSIEWFVRKRNGGY